MAHSCLASVAHLTGTGLAASEDRGPFPEEKASITRGDCSWLFLPQQAHLLLLLSSWGPGLRLTRTCLLVTAHGSLAQTQGDGAAPAPDARVDTEAQGGFIGRQLQPSAAGLSIREASQSLPGFRPKLVGHRRRC